MNGPGDTSSGNQPELSAESPARSTFGMSPTVAASLAFSLGCCGLWYPSMLLVAVGLLVPGVVARRARSWLPVAVGLAGGLLWAGWALLASWDARLPESHGSYEGRLVGWVADPPQTVPHGWRFVLAPDHSLAGVRPRQVQLFLADQHRAAVPMPLAGARWSGCVRLQSPRGLVNPGGWDYEAGALRRGIGARGSVRPCAGSSRGQATGVRALRNRLGIALAAYPRGPLLTAILTGDRGAVPERWQHWIQRTGTAHLFVISGLHLTFGALLGWWLGKLLAVALPVLRWRGETRVCAALVAMAVMLGYAAVAGWTLPVQRAAVMGLVGLGSRLLGHRILSWRGLLWALVVVLVIDPRAPLDAGMWLSFSAVGGLVLLARGIRQSGIVYAQTVAFFVLVPTLSLWMGDIPLVAWPINLLLVPLLGVLVVAPVLVGAVLYFWLPAVANVCWLVADLHLGLALGLLQAATEGPFPELRFRPGWFAVVALTGVAVLGAGPALARRWRVVALVTVMLLLPSRPPPGLAVFVADTGQGLSVAVRSGTRVMLYDTGAGNLLVSQVLPSLRVLGWPDPEVLVISHGDADHAAGLASLPAERVPMRVLAGEPQRLGGSPAGVERCRRGQRWRWGAVEFEILHGGAGGQANDRSCVLLVRAPEATVLLPGDIGAGAEQLIAGRLPAEIDLLIAPHHGSDSSSTWELSRRARQVVFSAGYYSPFGHPHPRVVDRYRRAGTTLWWTGIHGALLWHPDGTVRRWRCDWRPWRVPCGPASAMLSGEGVDGPDHAP